MESDSIEVQLSVEIKNEMVIAHLLFQNKSERKIYLNKQLIYDDGIVRNNYFEITSNINSEADYLGIMANCIRMPEEFVELNPDEKVHASIQLSEYYELIKGCKYNIQYSAFNPSFSEDQELMEMQSNKVEISY
jgi:hypothetical protein